MRRSSHILSCQLHDIDPALLFHRRHPSSEYPLDASPSSTTANASQPLFFRHCYMFSDIDAVTVHRMEWLSMLQRDVLHIPERHNLHIPKKLNPHIQRNVILTYQNRNPSYPKTTTHHIPSYPSYSKSHHIPSSPSPPKPASPRPTHQSLSIRSEMDSVSRPGQPQCHMVQLAACASPLIFSSPWTGAKWAGANLSE
ncbi:hypothetical protein BDV97DRAFT_85498 [Delphinella strobiligena]|nr:hypothetical protein BDV97DRAFT_85498 [Delphinella strobiligena]